MKTKIYYYYFDLSKTEEKREYLTLCEKLKAKGLKLFDGISIMKKDRFNWHKGFIKPLHGEDIELETNYLFDNQWKTAPTITSEKGLRVFDWSEEIYPNKNIKEGMYLDQTAEMKEIRKNTFKCGFCGKHYYKQDQAFCSHCLGSEYLKPENFPLLQLQPVKGNKIGAIPFPDDLVEKYNLLQDQGRRERLAKRNADKLKSIQKAIEASKKELEGFTWLIDHGLDFENWIYYSHSDTFCYGWRNPISEDERKQITGQLTGFPFTFTFKM